MSSTTAALYLWLGLEGLAGLTVGEDGVSMRPALPEDWRWLAATRIPCRDAELSFCYVDGVLHVDMPVDSPLPTEVYDTIEPVAGAGVFALLLTRGEEKYLFAASVDQEVDVAIAAGGRRWSVKLAAGEVALLS